MPSFEIDAAIVGGGIAGAWALNLLVANGYNALLLEADALGCDQTLASQGMIHGGLKYALAGRLTGASEAIADMPSRWRRCLAGEDPVDLSGTNILSDRYYMFSRDNAMGRLTTFFASKALRGRIDRLAPAEWPAAFAGFDGVVYGLNDFVLDARSLLQRLVRDMSERVLSHRLDPSNLRPTDGGYQIDLQDCTVHARTLISCAGNGSQQLLAQLGISSIRVQHRPLKQVIVRSPELPSLFAHCLTGVTTAEPRMTITSHQAGAGLVWYLGGRLATQGVARSDDEQIAAASAELASCVPWLDWHDADYQTLTVSRAEPYQPSGLKPDNAFVAREGSFIQCFPTKLTLAPDLGDRLLPLLPAPTGSQSVQTSHPRADVGSPPW